MIIKLYNKFNFYEVAHIFCNLKCIINLEDGTPLYYDSHHLSLAGAELLKPIFFESIGDQNTSRDEKLKNLIKILEKNGFKIKNKK